MGAAGSENPSGEPKSPLRFSDLILDFDARTLRRTSGEVIALTRSEFALLRFLAQRPGRVASRETLLDAVANRRFAPFDRSIDVVVGRLRRKVELDPRRPRIIVTVQGEGYRFDGLTLPCAPWPTSDAGADAINAEASSDLPVSLDDAIHFLGAPVRRFRIAYGLGALCLALLLALAGLWRHWPATRPLSTAPPRVLVLPFANLTGDASKDYLGRALAFEVTTFLGADPALRVVSSPAWLSDSLPSAAEAARVAGARYVVQGGVHRRPQSLRVTATLYDSATGTAAWSEVFDTGVDEAVGPKEDISRRIYDSLAGFRGKIFASEEQVAWGKSSGALDEYDYFLRGMSSYLRFSLADDFTARAILLEGLNRYPESVLLRFALARTHLWAAMAQANQDPRPDIEQAWRLVNEGLSARPLSPLETWLAHWLMAFLYQWRDNDFSRSVAEARKAVELAPYDAYSRNDLSWVLANSGDGEEAIVWARAGLDHDPNGPSRYHANLAWAYYVARHDQEAVDALGARSAEFPVLYAALLVRVGQVDRATALIGDYMKSGGGDTVAKEDIVPLVEPAGTEYLEVLRKAGLREK